MARFQCLRVEKAAGAVVADPALAGFLLTGWPFWGSADHGNADAQLKEIREHIRFVTRAQKGNKCPA